MVVGETGTSGYGVLLTGASLVALVVSTRAAVLLYRRGGLADGPRWLSAGVAVCEVNSLLLVVLAGYVLASDQPVPGALVLLAGGVLLAGYGSYRWVRGRTVGGYGFE